MASALVVETSVANNSPSQDFNYPDDVFQSRYVTPGFKAFFYSTFPITSALAFAFEAFVSRLKRLMFLCDRKTYDAFNVSTEAVPCILTKYKLLLFL